MSLFIFCIIISFVYVGYGIHRAYKDWQQANIKKQIQNYIDICKENKEEPRVVLFEKRG